ncbi:MAG: hypothetical protein HFH41_10225 [Lachnospiraceae bacterium]|nr:hypothetical protein [Lachnospiraceae bacterium]
MVINEISEAVGNALNSEFGDAYKIHMEESGQVLEKPCFFISCQNFVIERFPGKRCLRSSQFCIRYFPGTDAKQKECNEIAERMWQCLEQIRISGQDSSILGTKMRGEITGEALNFFVNYDMFVCRAESLPVMEGLTENVSVKG